MRLKFSLLLVTLSLFFVNNHQLSAQIHVTNWVQKPEMPVEKYPLIYVDFWATWCAPCISSMPHTFELEKKFGDRVLFLFLSNESPGKISRFMQKRNWHFVSATDLDEKSIENFGVQAIPQSFIIDPEGKIVWKGKPTELNAVLLENLIEKYHNQSPLPGRIITKQDIKKRSDWKIYTQDLLELKYKKVHDAENNAIFEPGNYYLSGNLEYIASQIKDVPVFLVVNKTNQSVYYHFSSEISEKPEVFKSLVQSFICRETPFKIDKTVRETKVFVLTDSDEPAFFSRQVYDFEKGNNVALIDDVSLTIDNASKKQMAEKLSETTGRIFVYQGNDNQIYDWNYVYDDWENLIQQLKDSGFEVKAEVRKLNFYEVIYKRH